MNYPRIGIVVPTLGKRIQLLAVALNSIRDAGNCHISIVCPDPTAVIQQMHASLFDSVIADPKHGLAAAINKGLECLPEEIPYVNWLGDDDELTKNSLVTASAVLDSDPNIVLVYGNCDYISETGVLLWQNRPHRVASALLHFGPQIVPQPGSLFRRDAFVKAGSLNTEFKYAFDLDMMLRLKKHGRFQYVNVTLSKFRWHKESLSVSQRRSSVAEASKIRRMALLPSIRRCSNLWELPMTAIIRLAGRLLNAKVERISSSNRTATGQRQH